MEAEIEREEASLRVAIHPSFTTPNTLPGDDLHTAGGRGKCDSKAHFSISRLLFCHPVTLSIVYKGQSDFQLV